MNGGDENEHLFHDASVTRAACCCLTGKRGPSSVGPRERTTVQAVFSRYACLHSAEVTISPSFGLH